ncbi:MAG: hypothetical protein JXR80_06250 [Deltaproteobacteria bacterium]|nr:hypothetical protein [Deltaproteobacteria bacterium]
MPQTSTILIVDDDPEVRRALKIILLQPPVGTLLQRGASLFDSGSPPVPVQEEVPSPYRLLFAQSGEEAVRQVTEALAEGLQIALAFIDMKMPGLNGAQTAAAIWQLDARIKAVFVTAYSEATPHEIIEITGRRDHFYLRKPFNGEVIRQFALALTEQWQLERERAALNDALASKNRKLAEFNATLEEQVKVQSAMLFHSEKMASIGILAAGVAHEINNPIAFVRSNLETLADYSANFKNLLQGYQEMAAEVSAGRFAEALRRIELLREQEELEQTAFALADVSEMIDESLDGTARIINIVNDLRYIARDDHEVLSYADVNRLLDSVLNLIAHQTEGRIVFVRQYEKIPEILCYPQQLSQVFMQILLNAVQAIAAAGTITVTTRETGDGLSQSQFIVVTITDDGCGIEEDDLKKVFDPFFTTREVGDGTGLGMSISHDIVKAHRGSIQVASKVGVGTTFTVRLPLVSGYGA